MLIPLTVLHIRQLNRRCYFCLVAITTQVVANSLKVWFSKYSEESYKDSTILLDQWDNIARKVGDESLVSKKKIQKNSQKNCYTNKRGYWKKKQSKTEIQQRRSSSSDLFAAALAAAALSLLCFCSAAWGSGFCSRKLILCLMSLALWRFRGEDGQSNTPWSSSPRMRSSIHTTRPSAMQCKHRVTCSSSISCIQLSS